MLLLAGGGAARAQVIQLTDDPLIQGDLPIATTAGGNFSVNVDVGAQRFYNAGFTGNGVIQTVVDAGTIWNGHESLQHNTVQIIGTNATGEYDAHATWVASMMGGRSTFSPSTLNGIAPNATLWSGAIASGWSGFAYSVSFNTDEQTVYSVYHTALISGVGGHTTDVINTSWDYTGAAASAGFTEVTIGLDGLIEQSLHVSVASAGNDGPGNNTVAGLAAGYNSISVGALGSATSSPPYSTVANFSSRSPNNVVQATTPTSGNELVGARVRVDLVAPGTDLGLALYDGQTGGNAPGLFFSPAFGTPALDPHAVLSDLSGTSFAAPAVSGGATLVVNAGKVLYGANANAVDPRVIKAVLMNSADKIPGWTNNSFLDGNGTLTTFQGLDYNSGAGAMNLNHAFDQYVDLAHGGMAGTTDVPGMSHGSQGNVSTIGWDFGQVAFGTDNVYFMNSTVLGGLNLTATLNWFVDRDPGTSGNFSDAGEQRFADLDLYIFTYVSPSDHTILSDVAVSGSQYNNTEEVTFNVSSTAFYGIRVSYFGDNWNFIDAHTVDYGLAWSADLVPEPGLSAIGMALGAGLCVWLFRRKNVALGSLPRYKLSP